MPALAERVTCAYKILVRNQENRLSVETLRRLFAADIKPTSRGTVKPRNPCGEQTNNLERCRGGMISARLSRAGPFASWAARMSVASGSAGGPLTLAIRCQRHVALVRGPHGVRGSTTPRASANSLNLCAARRRGARQIEVDDSNFTPDHREYLQEWADKLGVSVGVLVGRIVIATCKGDLYLEDAPEDRPCTP